MKKTLMAASLLALAATSANAYQTQLMAEVGYQDQDVGDASTPVTVEGRYYFTPVTVGNQPHQEAWFLNRNSNAGLALTYEDTNNVTSTDLTADVKYFVPATQFYVGGQLGSARVKVAGNSDSVTHYGLQVGYLPMNGLLLTAGLVGTSGNGNDNTDGAIGAKYVSRLAAGNYVNLEANVGFGDGTPLELGGDYYVDNTFGVGVGYSDFLDSDYNTDGVFEIRAKKFFNPMMAIGGKITTSDGNTGFAVNWTGRY